MSSVDTAWLRMDSSRNLMMIVGVWVFGARLAYEDMARLLEERLLAYRRFRQRVEADAIGYQWVDDDRFRIDRHLKRARLRGAGSDRELQRFTARLAAQPLDPAHPLWQFHLVENYNGTSAMVARIHHCIADGIALVRVTLSLTDAKAPTVPRSDEEGEAAELESNPWVPYLKPITRGTVAAIDATGTLVTKSLGVVANPERLADYAQVGSRLVRDTLAILLMSNDTPTRLKGTPCGRKAIAWNDPLPLDEVKAVCRGIGASVNDVLLSCVAGALRRYLLGRGDEAAEDCEVRAMVPVNLRPLDEPIAALGNRFGLVPLCLPVGIANPVERVREVRRRMDELKSGYQPIIAYFLLGAAGVLPHAVQTGALEYLGNKGTAVMTNVPGPNETIGMAGVPVTKVMVWVPQSGDIGIGVSILSYAGGVQFGVMSDTALCPEPQAIIDGFEPEFERLVLALAMLPNGLLLGRRLAPGELEHVL
ncbi:MAG: wax ester/triacylglycerol synthase family O-acyltransferase, partial [Burkholderiales bacterium]